MSKYLFEGNSTFALADNLQATALNKLRTTDENTILQTPTDDLVSNLLTEHAVHIPELREVDTWVDEKEVSHQVQTYGYDPFTDHNGGTRTITEHHVYFHVPFDGDRQLFAFSPSSRSIPGPEAEVGANELIITVSTDQKTEIQVRQSFDQRIQSIKQHLATMEKDLQGVTGRIESAARPYIEQRKAELLKSKKLVASLGFPMKRREDVPQTFRAPDVRRKIVPAKPQTAAPFKPEPALDEAEYQHILTVMDNMTKVMERSPHTFHNMGEEDIRQHFLVQLNGQYEGSATGETFNFQGKTDILIRSEGRNIFIAECKFWKGEKGFLDTVDQLLSYLSWRDSKSAVIIFNKNKNLTGVLTAIENAMGKHPHKKRGLVREGETRFRFVMGSPNDHAREIVMTVMVYDIPSSD